MGNCISRTFWILNKPVGYTMLKVAHSILIHDVLSYNRRPTVRWFYSLVISWYRRHLYVIEIIRIYKFGYFMCLNIHIHANTRYTSCKFAYPEWCVVFLGKIYHLTLICNHFDIWGTLQCVPVQALPIWWRWGTNEQYIHFITINNITIVSPFGNIWTHDCRIHRESPWYVSYKNEVKRKKCYSILISFTLVPLCLPNATHAFLRRSIRKV